MQTAVSICIVFEATPLSSIKHPTCTLYKFDFSAVYIRDPEPRLVPIWEFSHKNASSITRETSVWIWWFMFVHRDFFFFSFVSILNRARTDHYTHFCKNATSRVKSENRKIQIFAIFWMGCIIKFGEICIFYPYFQKWPIFDILLITNVVL